MRLHGPAPLALDDAGRPAPEAGHAAARRVPHAEVGELRGLRGLQARLAAREAETPTRQSEFSRENTGEGIHSLARTAIRRESSFVQRLLNKEKQLMNIRTYVNDSLRSHKMHHAYLRNSFLDPAIGLEFKLLEHGAQQGVLMLPNPDVEALEKALAACEVAQNELKIENCRLHLRLREAMERNNQLERECENLYLQQRQEM